MLREIGYILALALACLVVAGLIFGIVQPSASLLPIVLAVGVCLAASIVPVFVQHSEFARENPVATTFMTVGWRMGLLLVAILLSAATKWQHNISFGLSLLGCYFPFLALESCLAIRRIRLESRS